MARLNSMRFAMYMVLLLSLIPAAVLLVFSGLETRGNALRGIEMEFGVKLRLWYLRNEVVLDNTRVLMQTISELREVISHDAEGAGAVLAAMPLGDLYENIFVSDLCGNVFAAARNYRSGVNISDGAAYKNAFYSRDFTGGVLSEDPFTREKVFPLARCVQDQNGNVLGVICVNIKILYLERLADGLKLDPAACLAALDQSGTVLYAHTGQGGSGGLYGSGQRDVGGKNGTGGAQPVYDAWNGPASKKRGSGFYMNVDSAGRPVLNAYRHLFLPGSEAPVMTMHLYEPAIQAYASANFLLMRNIMLLMAAMAASLVIIWFMGRAGFMASLNSLLILPGRLASGQIGARSSPAGATRDLARLARAFDAMAASLEKRNAELTRERNEAFAASRVKSEFLTNMSHGIRTPMNSIIGMTYLVLKTGLNPKQKSYIDKIYMAANALLGIINDILDFSKIEAGLLNMEHAPFYIDDVVENVAALNYQKVRDKGLEFIFGVAPDMPSPLVGDALRLGQVLANLITNAVKFTEKGVITVRCAPLEINGDRVKISIIVKDTGIGISEEQMSKLFSAFTQADGSTTRRFGGTGLGLAISRRILALMDGDIGIKSEPGKGATVTATAWLRISREEEQEIKRIALGFAGLPVLLVDDSREAGQILEAQLAGLGLKVDRARTVQDAYRLLQRGVSIAPYRLVLLDLYMDAVDTLRHITGEMAFAQAPPVLVTTNRPFGPDMEAACVEAGAMGLVHKPVTQNRLVRGLDRIFHTNSLGGVGNRRRDEKSANMEARRRLRGLKVLLVEDNPINRQVAMELLADVGMAASAAADGFEALDMLAAAGAAFDVVLLDIQMPGIDGYEVARRIRAQARYASLPVIAMTAHAMEEERRKCLEAGMDDHIAKPLDVEKFYLILQKWLRNENSSCIWPEPAATMFKETKKELAAPKADKKSEGESVLHTVAQTGTLPPLPGLNPEAFKRLGGNTKLYIKLLTQFVEFYKDMGAAYLKAVQGGNLEEVTRTAHTLKGLAASIGADELSEAARLLESAHKAGELDRPDLSGRCFELLSQVQDMLAKALNLGAPADSAATQEKQPLSGLDREKGLKALADLKRYLTDDDAEAVRFFEINRSFLAGILDDAVLRRIDDAMARFELGEALELLGKN